MVTSTDLESPYISIATSLILFPPPLFSIRFFVHTTFLRGAFLKMNKFFLTAIAIVSLVPAVISLTIDTPASVVQCQPTLLTWNGGTGPYYLTILPGGQVSAEPMETFTATDDTSKTWIANLDSSQPVTFALKDSTGQTAFSDQVTIRPSNDQGCMTAATASTDSGAPSVSGASQSGTRAASIQTTAAAGGTTRATNAPASKTGSGGSTASGASNSNNAGGLSVGVLELAGALGLIGAVLF
ncbi:hypothetical protein AX14_004488 [Amanita brunnescens Koide BX004]|nr:hypothetical protein AX14_004488 [Amanita brunnescens Koide BX004]